jgi:hypothetical protein
MPLAPLVVALALLALPAQAAAGWRLPVAGSVTRGFDLGTNPYEGGHHRGIDLAARPGTTVRAPCTGRVAVAGRVGTSGGVVTLLCGRWRVTDMPLATIAVRAGTTVTTGTDLGTVAHSHDHAGLHVGVRRAGTRFGYVDPLRFLSHTPQPAPPLGRAPRSRPPSAEPNDRTRDPAPARWRAPVSALARSLVPVSVASPVSARARSLISAPAGSRGSVPVQAPLAPWPVWAGLALVLAGAGVRWRGAVRTRTRPRVRAGVRLNR